jgi:hypothetical protein
MIAATGFGIGAAGLMLAGCLFYIRQRPDARPVATGWIGWGCGQIVLLLLLGRLGAPQAALIAPGLGAVSALLVTTCSPGAAAGRREGPALILPAGVILWSLLLLGPVGDLPTAAEIRMAFALLSGLVAGVAGLALLAGACTDPAREPPLAWFLWSAGYGAAALAAMAAQLDWAYLVFPLLAQGILLVAGIVILGSGESGIARRIAAPDGAKAEF